MVRESGSAWELRPAQSSATPGLQARAESGLNGPAVGDGLGEAVARLVIIGVRKEVEGQPATGYRMLHRLACRFAFRVSALSKVNRLPHVAPSCVPALKGYVWMLTGRYGLGVRPQPRLKGLVQRQ